MLNKDLKHVPKDKDQQETIREALAAFLVAGLAWVVLIFIMALYQFTRS